MPDPDGRAVPPSHDAVLLQRARVLERIAGSAWHELAQPISGLRGFATVLDMEGWTTQQLGIDLRLVDEAALTTQRLTRSLTDLARGSTRAEALDVLVVDTLALAGHQLVDVRRRVDVPPGLPETALDPAVVRLAIASLVCDAIVALGGPREARGTLRWTGRALADGVELAIEDDGATAEPADLGFLRDLLAGEGATLRYEAPPTGGNRVVLVMPVLAGAPVQAAEPPVTRVAPAPVEVPPVEASLTVLVADDEGAVRDLLVRMLDRSGMRAIPAASGPAALDTLEREPVDLVIADRWMAGMSGLDLHRAVADRWPVLRRRFVLMSGDPGDHELVEFASAEGLEVLGKPFETNRLLGTLREVATR